jgi:ribosomal-protein-serine acetyltransferase
MMFLRHELGDGLALILRDLSTVAESHALTLANLDRLRQWEDWAHGEQTEEAVRAYTRLQLARFVEGRALPLAVLEDGRIVGTIGARIALHTDTAEIGYWIDAAAEGRGLVTRSVHAVVEHLERERGVRRCEIRTAATNSRSRAVAERVGFTLEGTLRSAVRVGPARQDLALYSRLA